MHIPEGYLCPQTYIPFYVAFFGLMWVALRKVKRVLHTRLVPFMGMASAFCFLIMMFNIPIPGGSTGHAVGAGLVALVFGPWIAFVSVSVALIVQAIVFGDGGLTAIGANCFNMAFVMPFVAYWVFRLICKNPESSRKMNIAAFFAGYISICMASLFAAIELGIQPLIASVNGVPLYAPFPLKVTIPAILTGHMFIFGIAEGLVTLAVFRFIYRMDSSMISVIKTKSDE